MNSLTLFAALSLPLLVACESSTSEAAAKPESTSKVEAPVTPASAPKVESAAKSETITTLVSTPKSEPSPKADVPAEMTLHQLKVESLDAGPVDLAKYKGEVVLVVNVASECGYTPQYKELEALERELSPKGFHVLGFPSNEFGGQEPGAPADIRKFCTEKYEVTFPLFAKVATKAGPEQSPVFTYLGGATGKLPSWNFCKYLVGRDGKVVEFYASKVKPDDAALRAEIEKALAAR